MPSSHLRCPSLLAVDHSHFTLDILVFDAELSPDENHGADAECVPRALRLPSAASPCRSPRAYIPALYTQRPRCVTELPRARPFSTYTTGNTACPPIHSRRSCWLRWASRGCSSPSLHVEERFRNSQSVSITPSLHPACLNSALLHIVLLVCLPGFWTKSCEWKWQRIFASNGVNEDGKL